MSNSQQLAALIRDVLHDRLENSTHENLAFEAASLRAFLFSTLDSLDHINGHVLRGEIHSKEKMSEVIEQLMQRITNSMANLEDVRIELAHHNEHNSSE